MQRSVKIGNDKNKTSAPNCTKDFLDLPGDTG